MAIQPRNISKGLQNAVRQSIALIATDFMHQNGANCHFQERIDAFFRC